MSFESEKAKETKRVAALAEGQLVTHLGELDDVLKNHPQHKFADSVYVAVCGDQGIPPNGKGKQLFRDKVFESCTASAVELCDVRMGAKGAAAVVKGMGALGNMKRLNLAGNVLRDQGVLPVCEAIKSLPSLRAVNLTSCGVGDKGATELATLMHKNKTLLSLELGCGAALSHKTGLANRIHAGSANLLGGVLLKNSTLTHLGLRGNPIGGDPQTWETFAAMLTRNKSLSSLNCEETGLSNQGCMLLFAALTVNSSLRHLNLAGNGIKEEAGDVLGQLLEKNSTICSLRLQNNQLGYGVMDFGRSLRLNSSVCVLNVGSNRLGDPGADVLAGVLRVNRSLTSLNVSNNGFTEKGGQAIASGLASNPVLTSLNISNNAVRDSSCIELSGSLIQNQCISVLDISSCKVGDRGIVAIMSAVCNNDSSVLRRIRARNNFVSGGSGDLLVNLFYRNQSITHADFRGNQLDHVRLSKIKRTCARNLHKFRDAEPRRLRKQIHRLKGEQVKLRKAENTLKAYQSSIEDIRKRVAELEADKKSFVNGQVDRRKEIKAQVEKEIQGIEEARSTLEAKKLELRQGSEEFEQNMSDLDVLMESEKEAKVNIDQEVFVIAKQLEEARSNELGGKKIDMKEQIELIKAEKTQAHDRLTAFRTSLGSLKAAYRDGTMEVNEIYDQLRAFMEENQVPAKKVLPIELQDSKMPSAAAATTPKTRQTRRKTKTTRRK